MAHQATPPSTKGVRFPPEPLTDREVKALLRACSRRSPSGIRLAALIVAMWRAGLRLAEALELRPSDLDLDTGELRVRKGKGGKFRTVVLDEGALAMMQRWLDKRAGLGVNGRTRIFCTITSGSAGPHETKAGKPLSQPYVRQALKRLATKAGIEKRVHPHGLRHSFAKSLSREGAPLEILRNLLGHSNVSTTNTYLRKLGAESDLEVLRGRVWSLDDNES